MLFGRGDIGAANIVVRIYTCRWYIAHLLCQRASTYQYSQCSINKTFLHSLILSWHACMYYLELPLGTAAALVYWIFFFFRCPLNKYLYILFVNFGFSLTFLFFLCIMAKVKPSSNINETNKTLHVVFGITNKEKGMLCDKSNSFNMTEAMKSFSRVCIVYRCI